MKIQAIVNTAFGTSFYYVENDDIEKAKEEIKNIVKEHFEKAEKHSEIHFPYTPVKYPSRIKIQEIYRTGKGEWRVKKGGYKNNLIKQWYRCTYLSGIKCTKVWYTFEK